MSSEDDKSIVVFDGDCIFCNTSVNFIIAHEKQSEKPLMFTNFDSQIGKKLQSKISDEIDSILFYKNGEILIKSNAVFAIAKYLKFPFNLISYFGFIPLTLRDGIYDFIAKHRKKILSKKSCEMPSEELKRRLI